MYNYRNSSDTFFKNVMTLAKSIVWKNGHLANKLDLDEDAPFREQYILARQGRLEYENLYELVDAVLILNLGIDEDTAKKYIDDPDSVPEHLRKGILDAHVEFILEYYYEKNNYYRMLNGLPDVEDNESSFFYNTKYPNISDSSTPIHELPRAQLDKLEERGFLSELYKENPTKKYLLHLTTKKIDIYQARMAKNYEILYHTDLVHPNTTQKFLETYNSSRRMVIAIYEQKSMLNKQSEYVGFIGMMILFSTIIGMAAKYISADITRDFFDNESMRYIYDSYGVPFIEDLPIEIHKKIVKNINIIISHKGSPRVLYDIFNLFGFEKLELFEYFFMKQQKFDSKGNPIFVKDTHGKIDHRKTYDVNFVKASVFNNPLDEIVDKSKHIPYTEITKHDPYWVDDENLLNKIYNENYNYMESQYLGIHTTFNLIEILYETCYFIKMILDNREYLKSTEIYSNTMHININIFDIVVYLCALVTKKYGFKGEIPNKPHEIGKLLGFNFTKNLQKLKDLINNNDFIKSDDIITNYLKDLDVTSLASVSRIYNNLTALRDYIKEKMMTTHDPYEYMVYSDLFNILMYSEYVDSTFKKKDGTTAETFKDLLSDINIVLFNKLEELHANALDNEISSMLFLLTKSVNGLKQLEYADNANLTSLIQNMLKLVEFFKSAKSDVTLFEVVYSLASSTENIVKLLAYISHINDDHREDPFLDKLSVLNSMIHLCKDQSEYIDKLELLTEIVEHNTRNELESAIKYLRDDLELMSEKLYFYSEEYLFHSDHLSDVFEKTLIEDGIEIKEQFFTIFETLLERAIYKVSSDYTLVDTINHILNTVKDDSISSKMQFVAMIILSDKTVEENVIRFMSDYVHNNDSSIIDRECAMRFSAQLIIVGLMDKLFSEHRMTDELEDLQVSKARFIEYIGKVDYIQEARDNAMVSTPVFFSDELIHRRIHR